MVFLLLRIGLRIPRRISKTYQRLRINCHGDVTCTWVTAAACPAHVRVCTWCACSAIAAAMHGCTRSTYNRGRTRAILHCYRGFQLQSRFKLQLSQELSLCTRMQARSRTQFSWPAVHWHAINSFFIVSCVVANTGARNTIAMRYLWYWVKEKNGCR